MDIENLKNREKEIEAKIYSIDTGREGIKPMADGIINVEKYLAAKYRILWIMKEAFDDDNRKNGKMGGGGMFVNFTMVLTENNLLKMNWVNQF